MPAQTWIFSNFYGGGDIAKYTALPMSETLMNNLGPHLPTLPPHAHISLDNRRSTQIPTQDSANGNCHSFALRLRKDGCWPKPGQSGNLGK